MVFCCVCRHIADMPYDEGRRGSNGNHDSKDLSSKGEGTCEIFLEAEGD